MHEVSVDKVLGTHEECLKAFLCTRYDRCIVSEKQSSDYSNKDYRKQIALAASISIIVYHNLNINKSPKATGPGRAEIPLKGVGG